MKNIVNGLTIIRLIATFLLPIIWTSLDANLIILIVIGVLLTDFFDGLLARKFHVQTLFGSILDTIADKMFGIMVLVIISKYYSIFSFIVIFEIIIALINVYAVLKGAATKSSFLGRVKMWIMGLSVVFGLLAIFSSDIVNIIDLNLLDYLISNKLLVVNTSVLITVGAEIMVVIDYARRIGKELSKSKNKIKYKLKDDDELMKVLFDTQYYLKHKTEPLSKLIFK